MLGYSVLKYIEKASRLYNLAVRGNSEIYGVEEKFRISMSIHFRRGKEANRLACKPDVTRFRLGQSDKATCDEKKERALKKKLYVRTFVASVAYRPKEITTKRRLESHRVKNTSRDVGKFEVSEGREKYEREKREKYMETPPSTFARRNKLDANHETLEFQMQRFRGMLVVQITLFIRLIHTSLIKEDQLESTDNYICVKFVEANIVADR